MPRPESRCSVIVELRTSMSISPDCRAVKRCCADSGTNLVLVESPSTAAATAPHISTSRPFHLPWLSGSEKPPRPVLTPQITWPRFFTTSSVDSACAAKGSARAAARPMVTSLFKSCMKGLPYFPGTACAIETNESRSEVLIHLDHQRKGIGYISPPWFHNPLTPLANFRAEPRPTLRS